MAAFPSNPNDGDRTTRGVKEFEYNSTKGRWEVVKSNVSATALGNVSVDVLPDGNETRDLGSPTNRFKDLYLSSNTIYLGNTALSAADVLPFDLDVQPEVLEIQADSPDAGHGERWLWTWEQSTLPYARTTITNTAQTVVPLYMQGTYQVNNFASSLHGAMTQTHSLYLKWVKGPGTDNLVSWATQSTVTDSHPDIDSGNSHTIERLDISVPSSITIPTLNLPTNVSYNVSFVNPGAYTFTGTAHGDNVSIGPLYRGATYTFNVNASGHPFYITTDNGTNFAANTYFGEYTSGVTNSRTQSGALTFTVPADAPDVLYYQCGVHSSMRGTIEIKDLAVETNADGNYIIYFQHSQQGHENKVEIKPIPSLTQQMCIVYDGTQFVPQDLSTYVDNTPSFKNKIKEVAGTATLIAPEGTPVVASVSIVEDGTYLPYFGNETGDLAFVEDTQIMYVWDGTTWKPTRPASSATYLQLNQAGELEVTTGDVRWTAPRDITIASIQGVLGTAATGANLIATVNKNGTVINTITINAGSTSVSNDGLSLSVAAGDYLTVDITQIGSTTAGSDLNVIIEYS